MQDENFTPVKHTEDQIIAEVDKAAMTSLVFEVKRHTDAKGRTRDYVLGLINPAGFNQKYYASLNEVSKVWNTGDYDDAVWKEAKEAVKDALETPTHIPQNISEVVSTVLDDMLVDHDAISVEMRSTGLLIKYLDIIHVYEHSSATCPEEGSLEAAMRDILLQLPAGRILNHIHITPDNTESVRALSEDEAREITQESDGT